jgi:hypothetical protein
LKRFHVQFVVETGDDVTFDEVKEFVRFQVGDNSEIRDANPLSDQELQPAKGSFAIWPIRS